eukprot:5670869-Pyramimonas_sp.AAC.1
MSTFFFRVTCSGSWFSISSTRVAKFRLRRIRNPFFFLSTWHFDLKIQNSPARATAKGDSEIRFQSPRLRGGIKNRADLRIAKFGPYGVTSVSTYGHAYIQGPHAYI